MPWWIHREWESEEDALPADKTSTADKTQGIWSVLSVQWF